MLDLVIKVIRWFLSLFGIGGSPELTEGEKARRRQGAIQGWDEIEGAENIHVHGTGPNARIVRTEDGAQLVEDGGQSLWVDTVNKQVPAQAWRDFWGPLGGREGLVDFIVHEMIFNETQSADPLAAEAKLQGFGYRSVGDFYKVRATILKHFATFHGPKLDDCVLQSQEFMNATMQASRRRYELERQANLASNPALLAPIEGITLEVYAMLAARANGMAQGDFQRLLAEHRLDNTAWHRVNAGWCDRMSKDTTGHIATAYGEAFMKVGAGQYGAAGQAAAAQSWGGGAASGPEPMPFDRVCEIQGALSAWSKSGKDVNTLLHQHFGLNAMDFSNIQMWWMTQLTSDMRRFDDYNRKIEHWEQRYLGPQTRRDQDIQF